MNIAQAMKERSRIVGRIAKLESDLFFFNRFHSSRASKKTASEVKEIFKNLQEEKAELTLLKSKISKANSGISDKLVELSELKSYMKFLSSFKGSCEEEDTVSYIRDKDQKVIQIISEGSHIKYSEIEEAEKSTQNRINSLQDEIDTYNALTKI